MKEYFIDMDVTFSARMYITAENEETAKQIAIEKMEKDPRYHTRFGAYVNTEVTDVYEEN
jgi:hypothetical protein